MAGEEPVEGLGVPGASALNQAEGRFDISGRTRGIGGRSPVKSTVAFGHREANREIRGEPILQQGSFVRLSAIDRLLGQSRALVEGENADRHRPDLHNTGSSFRAEPGL